MFKTQGVTDQFRRWFEISFLDWSVYKKNI